MIFNKKERVIIIGCGRMGGRLATVMADRGYQVIVIDNRPEAFYKLPESFGGIQIQADGIDIDTLKYAEIEEASVFVAATGNDNMNSLLAQVAARIYGVPKVYVRFEDADKEKLIRGFNIHGIYPFKLSVADFEDSLFGSHDEDEEEDAE
ncbi:MAG: TrkA family potassium uptake protein [Clostridia bacterium]|nr:TrkA family potassium uptake protein [Clostridia bacterium]